MEKFTDTTLIEAIEAVIEKSGVTQSQFGLMAVNDASLLPQLRGGRELRRATRAKVLLCIERLNLELSGSLDKCLTPDSKQTVSKKQGNANLTFGAGQ